MRGLQRLSSAEATLKGIETFRAIRGGHFESFEPGVLNEIRFLRGLFEDGQAVA